MCPSVKKWTGSPSHSEERTPWYVPAKVPVFLPQALVPVTCWPMFFSKA
jgi:hypothetical protein